MEGVKNTSDIESPFQKWAIDQINALEFSCDWEIGVRGYRIDIGVKHKDYPNGYILAVETEASITHQFLLEIETTKDKKSLTVWLAFS